MPKDQLNNGGISLDGQSLDTDPQEPRFEDPQPTDLRPQEMSRAEGVSMKPRIRDQALPEKDDDRFFDRWVVDKAQALGSRAVRQPAIEKLVATVRRFAEWRSLRHAPAAERQSFADKELVASTPERIKSAEAKARQLDARAEGVEQSAAQQVVEVERTEGAISRLRPALRGSGQDFSLLSLANLVIFGIDFFIIQVALETVPGTAEQHRLTAIGLGAGAALVGDILGWMAAGGSIRRDGSLHRPSPVSIGLVTGLLILSVWFFGELGEFREFGLNAAKEANGAEIGEPTFFTIAQILFLLATAVASFAFVARRTGRELQAARDSAREKREKLKGEADALRRQAEAERQKAADAPGLCRAAEERIRLRARIAKGMAEHDLKQGEYLESLIVPEYMHARAGVESGISGWTLERVGARASLRGLAPWAQVAIAAGASLAMGGMAYWIIGSPLISIVTAAFVAGAMAMYLSGEDETEPNGPRRYVARLLASIQKPGQRATDIDWLVPQDGSSAAQEGDSNGNGTGTSLTREELEKRYREIKEIFDDED